MNFYVEIFRISLALIILGLFALIFVKPGSAEFYVDIMGISVCSAAAILSFLKIRKSSGR